MSRVVQVLLSSYNGEKYIREQLDSILEQNDVQVQILVRDDGSKDGTAAILSEYEQHYDNVRVMFGENVGVIQSFFKLVEAADTTADYISFADQDDVWLPDKLARAVRMLKENEPKSEPPLVYCSAKQLVDANLRPMKSAIRYKNVRTEFGNALVENMCTGCTCVINQAMLGLLKEKTPEFTVMHDFWIYLVGTCFGTVLYDEESRILYRQHGSNELGAASSLVENYRRRIKYYKKHRGQLSEQTKEFLRIYAGQMSKENVRLAKQLTCAKENFKVRRKILKEHRLYRQRKSDDLIFRWMIRMKQI